VVRRLDCARRGEIKGFYSIFRAMPSNRLAEAAPLPSTICAEAVRGTDQRSFDVARAAKIPCLTLS